MAERLALQAERLTRRFGDFTAVDAVSFEVGVGDVFGFLGPNGAGKTTTIKMLTGLLPPTEGRAVVAGHDVVGDRRGLKRDIGYMSQLFSLYLDLTVEENIELFAGLYEVRGARYEERRDWVLSMAGLEDARRRRTGQLPLGWKQRRALRCAVLHEPPVLFLDEPTSGVDPAARRAFWDMIYGLAEDGTTVLVSTHYMQEAEYCGRVALLNRGKLIALDRPAALRTGLAEPILELRTDDAARAVEALAGGDGIIEAAMFGRRVHVATEDEDRARRTIRGRLGREGLAVERLERIEPSLEDVFVSLVRREGGTVAG
jgi:ABC-2 type transport system ATP-binding protein